jgi:hypothetical protein
MTDELYGHPGWGWGTVTRKLAEAPNNRSFIDQSQYEESDSRCAGQAVEIPGAP